MSDLFRGRHLHSSYGPDREARRWVDTLGMGSHQAVFLVGDALGHAKREMKRIEGCRVWSLVPDAGYRELREDRDDLWTPQDGPLDLFLEKALEISGVEGVRLEVWPAFDRTAPDLVEAWGQAFRRIFRQVQGSRLTEQRFGPSFWKNTLRNLIDWELPLEMGTGDKTIVIAASGPSLEDCRDWLSRHRSELVLWALPSSFEALKTWGLRPDAGIATDGGYYAREHLSCLEPGVPLVSAANGAPDPGRSPRPTLFFSQATAPERIFLPLLAPQAPEIPPKGTVAVSAIHLALAATSGPVLVAGMDLGFHRLQAHAAPHTNETYLRPRCGRLNPWDSLAAHRALVQGPVLHHGVRTSPAMLTYAQWLDGDNRFPRTVYRLHPSGLGWKSMEEVDLNRAPALLVGHRSPQFTEKKAGSRSYRQKEIMKTLAAWCRELENRNLGETLLVETARTAAAADLGRWQKFKRTAPDSQETREAWEALQGSLVQFFTDLVHFAGAL